MHEHAIRNRKPNDELPTHMLPSGSWRWYVACVTRSIQSLHGFFLLADPRRLDAAMVVQRHALGPNTAHMPSTRLRGNDALSRAFALESELRRAQNKFAIQEHCGARVARLLSDVLICFCSFTLITQLHKTKNINHSPNKHTPNVVQTCGG